MITKPGVPPNGNPATPIGNSGSKPGPPLAMRRLRKLKTSLLALVFSLAAETLCWGLGLLGMMISPPNDPVLAWRFFGWVHLLPEWLWLSAMKVFKPFHDIQSFQAELTGTLVILGIALLQWYVPFLIGISGFRRFYRKSA